MKQKIITKKDGVSTWKPNPTYKYSATGINRAGKRFSIISKDWKDISGINIFQGSKWLIDETGKKHLICRIYN